MTRRPISPILCLVTDRSACHGRPLEPVVTMAVEAGVNLVQLREKDLPARELVDLGRRLAATVRRQGASLVVNDRVDVAMVLEADGVHLGWNGLPVPDVRRLIGPEMTIGVSVHSLEEAVRAEDEGADYVALGTIFETASHPGRAGAGTDLVAKVASSVRIPVIAIGGITAGNARSVMDAGASGVAVIRAIQSADDVAAATRALLRAMTGTEPRSHEEHEGARRDQV